MTDVSDVHHVLDAVAQEFERATKDVGVQEGPEVADMRIVVDGGTAGVEGEGRRGKRRDRMRRAGEGVVDAERGHRGDDMSRWDQESALCFRLKFMQLDTDIPEIDRLRHGVGKSWIAVAETALYQVHMQKIRDR